MRFTAIRNGAGRRPMLLIGALLAIAMAGSAGAAGLPQIVHARQAHFKALGRAAKSLRDQIGRSHPDWSLVASEASRIQHLASALPSWFPAGSGKGHGVKTRAGAAIWARPHEFARAAQTLLNRAQNVTRAAASHDPRALALGSRALGQSCGGCHRRFRARSSWW